MNRWVKECQNLNQPHAKHRHLTQQYKTFKLTGIPSAIKHGCFFYSFSTNKHKRNIISFCMATLEKAAFPIYFFC